jgi:ubiquinone biosynthesis protein UbiJ
MLDELFLAALNHMLRQNPGAREQLVPYAGQTVRLVAGPLDVSLCIDGDGATALCAAHGHAVAIHLASDALLAGLGDRGALMRGARVEGNAEFAEAFGAVLRGLRWDAAEDLSPYLGDVLAERAVSAVQGLLGWQREVLARLAGNAGEYLADEARLLLRPEALAQFAAEMAELRDDVARLAKRVERLGSGI